MTNQQAPSESWEKECLETFFVYNMKRGKHGDHVGAQHELIEFVRKVRAEAVEEDRKKIKAHLLLNGHGGGNWRRLVYEIISEPIHLKGTTELTDPK